MNLEWKMKDRENVFHLETLPLHLKGKMQNAVLLFHPSHKILKPLFMDVLIHFYYNLTL